MAVSSLTSHAPSISVSSPTDRKQQYHHSEHILPPHRRRYPSELKTMIGDSISCSSSSSIWSHIHFYFRQVPTMIHFESKQKKWLVYGDRLLWFAPIASTSRLELASSKLLSSGDHSFAS